MFSRETNLMTSKLVCVPSSVSTYHARQTAEWLDIEDIRSQAACAKTEACNFSSMPACTEHIEHRSRFYISTKRRHIASRAEHVVQKDSDLIGGRARVYKAPAICSQVVLGHHVTDDH